MNHIYDDGGRAAAGFKGSCGDCVTRAIAIAGGLPYREVYDMIAQGNGTQRRGKGKTKGHSARSGVYTGRKWFKDLMARLGWTWVPTMGIGTGCKVHLHDGELPMGRLIVSVSKHYTTVIDGVIRDTFDPQRDVHCGRPDDGKRPLRAGEWVNENGICWISRRCVYGYWRRTEVVS